MDLLDSFAVAIPFSYAALFPVLNPLGATFIFYALTSDCTHAARAQLARKVAFNTFYLLLAVFCIGGLIMRFFGITIPIVQVAGGLIVACIGWSTMNQKPDEKKKAPTTSETDASRLAFFPLTMPLTAGPGTIAVALTLGDTPHDTWGMTLSVKLGNIIALFLVAATVYFCYRYSENLIQKISANGVLVINKLTAFLYLCIGVTILWRGISQLLLSLSNVALAHLGLVHVVS